MVSVLLTKTAQKMFDNISLSLHPKVVLSLLELRCLWGRGVPLVGIYAGRYYALDVGENNKIIYEIIFEKGRRCALVVGIF